MLRGGYFRCGLCMLWCFGFMIVYCIHLADLLSVREVLGRPLPRALS
jgi:hypothetical protein